MKKISKIAILLALCCFISLLVLPTSTAKAGEILPTGLNNLRVGFRNLTHLVALDDGYMRVFFDREKIGIEYYDNDFNIQSKKSVEMELSIWGGFYASQDAYYIVEGQANTDESDTAEVIRVNRYDTNWNKTGTASITGNPSLFGAEVRFPFDYGCVEMTEYNGTLYIVTGHQGYVDPMFGQGHQGFLMIAVDEAFMTGNIVDCDLWHSFAQYIARKDSNLYVLEQSEGSRYTQLSKYDAESLEKESMPVLQYGGSADSAWATACYASVDDMAISSENVLCLGTSIDQSQYNNVTSETAHNIYLTVTPTSDFSENATTVKWLTNYNGGGKCFYGTKITGINENRFMVSWEEYGAEQPVSADDSLSSGILHYLFLDGAGNIISQEFTQAAPISDCHPVVKGSKIVYSASNANMVNFYSIDAETGEFGKKTYRVAGENATWNLVDGVLTISGIGAMIVDTQAQRRPAVSTTEHWFIDSGNHVWGPISENVKKIVITQGITDIPESAFENFKNLTEVEIESGVKSIGKKAFYGCSDLSKITIPASVTSIGEDFLWTGEYWVSGESHVVNATICAPQDSYAAQYAKENGIRYTNGEQSEKNDKEEEETTSNPVSIVNAKVSGLKKSYAYNGKEVTPKVTVTLGNKKLKEDEHYIVDYDNNSDIGKATIKIKGIFDYSGTIQKTFLIVPKKAKMLKLKSVKPRTIDINWRKDSKSSGYQIQYAANSKFTKNRKKVNVENNLIGSKRISKLVKGRKYYVRVRSYRIIVGKKYYGSWSKVKKVKCK